MIEERLRCPDCFRTGLRTADGSAGMQIVCERCGGEMKLRGHVLHA